LVFNDLIYYVSAGLGWQVEKFFKGISLCNVNFVLYGFSLGVYYVCHIYEIRFDLHFP
jgi:hypothetical protein